jgi:PAS domain S-box-containing protein
MKERQSSVLIVAAAPEDRAALRDALSSDPAARYLITEAESGLRALEGCRAWKPDCLILDLDLPDLSGLDALKELTAEEGEMTCAVVALVGAGDAQLAYEAMKSGAHDCLEKGRAGGTELRRAVSQAIEKAEQRRRASAREHELIEKIIALETDLAVLGREAAGRGQEVETWQVARAGVGPSGAVVSRPDRAFYNQTEEQLRLLNTAIEQSSESVMITTAQLDRPGPQIVYVNPAFTKMTGYAPEEVIGKTPRILQGPKTDRAVLARLREDCKAGKIFHGEAINYRKDGSEFYLEWSIRPVENERGAVTHFVAIQRDVTERRRIEDALRNNEAQLRAILDHSTAVIFVKDLEGRYLRINRLYETMYGVTEAEVKGKTNHDIHAKEVADVMLDNDREVIAANRPLQFEEQVDTADGRRQFISLKFPLYDDSGRPYGVCGIATDITERKRAEGVLKKSEERLNIAMEAGGIGTVDWDIRADSLLWSEKFLDIYGLPRGRNSGRYEDWREHVYPEDLPAVEALIWGTLEKKLPDWHVEYRIVRADNGEVRWIESRHRVFYDTQGAPLRTVGAALDITDRILAEEAIRESEARLRQLADAMPQIVYTCGPDGMVDYGNQQWVEYVGVPVEQSLGSKWIEAIHPDDRESTRRRVREAGETGQPFETEYRLRRKDGQYRWYLARGTPIRDAQGRIVKWIGTATDIHDRKQAEAEREELLAREQAARADAEHSAESIRRLQAVTDSALAPLTLDDLLHEMLLRIRELLATDYSVILLLTEDEQSLSVRATIGWDETVKGLLVPVGRGAVGSIAANRAPLVVEDLSTVEVIHPILRQKARSLIGAPLIVEGRLIGVIHADTARPRRFTEDDVRLLQLAADRVALAIEHMRLYEVEQQARSQAEEANRMKDEFLAIVSHELRSPLNAMLGYAAMLRRSGLDAQKVKQAAEVIDRSGKAQLQLIDDLLDTARIISGKLRLEVEPVDLVSVIEQAVQTIKPAADAKGISLETNLPSEIGQITGDPSRLQQVVWNLLSNAVKFTPHGGLVEARLERVDPHICITVTDTGKGIGSDFLPHVFDRFRQADASSARRYGGLGLGLALVKYLVELHGGTIEVASAGEGQGATFKVTLPVRAVATPLGEAGGEPVTVKRSGELAGVRALVVDDDDNARELLEAVLAQYGAEVVAVSSAAEAYALITATPPQELPDVMVTDIGMPGEDGYSLMRRVREWEFERGVYIPAVALTAYGRPEDRMRALRSGFQMHVVKPVEPAELAAVITSLIRRPMAPRR